VCHWRAARVYRLVESQHQDRWRIEPPVAAVVIERQQPHGGRGERKRERLRELAPAHRRPR
jgi:hypothetical protein